MKILYLILPLWILIALPSFGQNFIPQTSNHFITHKQAQHRSPKERKDHRGSGRRQNNFGITYFIVRSTVSTNVPSPNQNNQ